MRSLVRLLIGFVLIYHSMPKAGCKVIKQRDGHDVKIKETEVNYERLNRTTHFNVTLNGPHEELTETSIKYTNGTQSSSGSNINSLTHIPSRNHLDSGRSLLKLKKSLSSVKRSFKKIFFAWTYFGPEVGLCTCLFKYAWFTYPIVPEMTHLMMGRARRMVNGFMHDFWRGYAEEKEKEQYRISSKVADMTADDYYEYKNSQLHSSYEPFRRVDTYAGNLPENVPIIQKSNPQIANVVEMLKNLEPKANITDFIVRLARHIKSQPQKPHNAQQFRFVSDDGDEIRNFSNHHRRNETKVVNNVTKPTIKATKADGVVVEGRSVVASNIRPFPVPNVDRVYQNGPPEGLPSFNELPPADYSYYKNGVHHHVHDLRKEKGTYPVKGGGWLSVDLEENILSALGLSHPGRSVIPSVLGCSKSYALQVVFRFFKKVFFG